MADVKIFRRLALQLQAGSSYEDSAMFLMPFNTNSLNQTVDPIRDDSIIGEGFDDIPQLGPTHQVGSITQNLDVISCAPILEACMGSRVANVYTFANHAKKLSSCFLNSVSANQYANSYIKRMKISGSSANLIKLDYDLFGTTRVVREATSAFPSAPTAPGNPFTFHEMGGVNGYVRVGDAVDGLTSSDNISIEDFSIEFNGGFDEQFDNVSVLSMTPVYGMTPFQVSGSFRLSRYDNNQWLTWADDFTPLQMEMRIYKSATENITIRIPRFNISAEITDDDLPKMNITMGIGRNGTGTSYKNANMTFTSPMQITVDNS